MKVVIVESPAKAKTINKYLGNGYKVMATYGHIRDLPSKDGSVRPDDSFAMEWKSEPKAQKQIRNIRQAVKGAKKLILATDPDREGEAISWHVKDVLENQRALNGITVERVVFNEVTKKAVIEAMNKPRNLDQSLVDAYFARRAIDYLMGYRLSRVLWRKLPNSKSAGRVQSPALRLISEREAEIEIFKAEEFWTVDVDLRTSSNSLFSARLTHIDGKRLEKFSISNKEEADATVTRISSSQVAVSSIERKRIRRNPYAPFTTSTLQQEASRKLGMSASRTMNTAQRLYEGVDIGGETVGLITYMRTDGVQMSLEAIETIRKVIQNSYGVDFIPANPRIYKTQAKNAQEAHEAIRPTDTSRHPKDIKTFLEKDQARLYELIWKRAVASQMASAQLDQTTVIITATDRQTTLRANGSVIAFDGFLKLYQEDQDDPLDSDRKDDRLLPPMKEGEELKILDISPSQHFTQPPPRFTEASLVKRLEELGMGRPSTYASIIQVLQDRNYVRLERKRFIPEDRGRLVTAFLVNFFEQYVQYNFTADLETELDEISDGKLNWKTVLKRFWEPFIIAVEDTKELRISEVLDRLNDELGKHFFPENQDGTPARNCPRCENGLLSLKLGKYGAFIGCSGYPECKFTRQFAASDNEGEDETGLDEPKILGQSPTSGADVTLRKGPYGYYIQLGEQGKTKADKPKRVSLLKTMSPSEMDFGTALGLLSLPKEIGAHPEDGQMIFAGIGRFGPYIKHNTSYTSVPADDSVLDIGLNRAVDLIATNTRKKPSAKLLGKSAGKEVTLQNGRYGPYVQRGKVRATIPKSKNQDTITLEEAIDLIEAKTNRLNTKSGAPKKTPQTARGKTTKNNEKSLPPMDANRERENNP